MCFNLWRNLDVVQVYDHSCNNSGYPYFPQRARVCADRIANICNHTKDCRAILLSSGSLRSTLHWFCLKKVAKHDIDPFLPPQVARHLYNPMVGKREVHPPTDTTCTSPLWSTHKYKPALVCSCFNGILKLEVGATWLLSSCLEFGRFAAKQKFLLRVFLLFHFSTLQGWKMWGMDKFFLLKIASTFLFQRVDQGLAI